MLELREIKSEEETLAAFRKFTSGTELPPFLFHDPQFHGIVLELLQDGRQMGLSFGVTTGDDPHFYLHHLSMDSSCRRAEQTAQFFDMVFEWVGTHLPVTKAAVSMIQEDDSRPEILDNLERLDAAEIKKVEYVRQVGMKTAGFDHLRSFRWYRPHLLEQKGYEILFWRDFSRQELAQLQQEEEMWQAEDPGYLGPGVWDAQWEYDKDTSCALVKRGSRKPLGWMVAERQKDGNTVKVKRFYVRKEERSRLIGHSFGSAMLDIIEPHCENFQYEVIQGNRQMEAYTDNFCTPILAFHYFRCNILMNLKKEEQSDEMDTGTTE